MLEIEDGEDFELALGDYVQLLLQPEADSGNAGGKRKLGASAALSSKSARRSAPKDPERLALEGKYATKVSDMFNALNSGNHQQLMTYYTTMFIPDVVVTETFVGVPPPDGSGLGKKIKGLDKFIEFMQKILEAVPDGLIKLMEIRLRKKAGCVVLDCSYKFGGTAVALVKPSERKPRATVKQNDASFTSEPMCHSFCEITGTMSLTFNDDDKVQQVDFIQSFVGAESFANAKKSLPP